MFDDNNPSAEIPTQDFDGFADDPYASVRVIDQADIDWADMMERRELIRDAVIRENRVALYAIRRLPYPPTL